MYQDKQTNYGGSIQDYQRQMAEKQAYAARLDTQMQSGLVGASEQRPQGTLESAISSVAIGIDEAFAAVDRLSEKLAPVLQPEMPTPICDNSAKASMPTSTAVSYLHAQRSMLESLVNRINALNARLDT